MGVTSIHIEAFGTQGGTADEDAGTCEIGGWNGAGESCENLLTCAKGGGASDVRQGGAELTDRVIVAGGGVGAEYSGCNGTAGDGSGLNGDGRTEGGDGGHNGGGGTQVADGAGGTGTYNGLPGSFGFGGNSGTHPAGHSGSGGGGWYGGGGSSEDGHAGGGSSYVVDLVDGTTVTGVREGHGQISITQLCESIEVVVSSDEICLGESFTLDGSGIGDITWDGGVVNGEPFTPDAAGVFTYNATRDSDEDCGFYVDITVYDLVEITYATLAEDAGSDGEIDITVTGGNPAYVFDWDNDGTGDFDDTEDLTGLMAGTYVVDVMCDAGCSDTETIVLGNVAGIEELESNISIYPNPTTDNVTITVTGNFQYELTAINGELIASGKAVDQKMLSVEDLSAGTYLVKIIQNGEVNSVKVLKQ